MTRRPWTALVFVAIAGCAHRPDPFASQEQAHSVVVSLHCGFNLPVYLVVGDTLQLLAARTDVGYDALVCLDSMVPGSGWRSSDGHIVAVTDAGLARALQPGHVTLSAQTEFGPATGEAVALPWFAHFGFGAESLVVDVGVYHQLTLEPRDARGVPIDAWADFFWLGSPAHGLGWLIGGGAPSITFLPVRPGRAFLVGRIGAHADTVLIIARPPDAARPR